MSFLILRHFGTPHTLDWYRSKTCSKHQRINNPLKGGIQLAYVTPAEDGFNRFFVCLTRSFKFLKVWCLMGLQGSKLFRPDFIHSNSHVMIWLCVVERQRPRFYDCELQDYENPLDLLTSPSGVFEYHAAQPERMGRAALAAIFGFLVGKR